MAEKKVTTKVAAAKTTTQKAAPKKTVAKKVEIAAAVNAESVGFRAGDVYQTLAASGKPLSVANIAKLANITIEEAYLGIGWLFKEGKVKDEGGLLALA